MAWYQEFQGSGDLVPGKGAGQSLVDLCLLARGAGRIPCREGHRAAPLGFWGLLRRRRRDGIFLYGGSVHVLQGCYHASKDPGDKHLHGWEAPSLAFG